MNPICTIEIEKKEVETIVKQQINVKTARLTLSQEDASLLRAVLGCVATSKMTKNYDTNCQLSRAIYLMYDALNKAGINNYAYFKTVYPEPA